MKMKYLKILTMLFLMGFVGYYTIEVVFRGYSHWTMGLCGGICLMGMYLTEQFTKFKLPIKAFIAAIMITAVEFVAGCILNLWLNLGIWNYSGLKFHLLGQISLLFSVIWYILCLAVFAIFKFIKYQRKKRMHLGSIRNSQ